MAIKEGRAMSQVYVSMAMSLDGFITGPHDDAQNPAGINGIWLLGSRGRSRGDRLRVRPSIEERHKRTPSTAGAASGP